MKKVVSFVILISMTLLLVSMPAVSAQTYSGFSRFTDNIRLFFAGGDNKANLALDIREKEVNSAISNLEAGNTAGAEKNLNSASEKLKIVQTLASPDISVDVKENIVGVESKIKDTPGDYALLDNYLNEEEKTKLSMDISEKVFSYCDELAMQDYAEMQKDEKCQSYAWMENKIKQRLTEEQKNAKGEIEIQVQACINNPKECSCDNIKLLSEKTKCEEYKSLAIKCEFQNDDSACEEIKMFNLQDTERTKYEKEIMEKYLPAECSEAGVRDGEECKKLILTLNQPKSECMENGVYIGEEKCKEKLVSQGDVVKECVVDGKLVDPEQCRNIVKEGNKPTGEEFALMSGECKERGVYDPIACEEIVNLPRPCKDAGFYTKKECESMTLNQNLPKECVDAGALTPEACEKLKLPADCEGANSREECETIKIELKYPEECKSAGEYDPEKCAVIMIGDNIVPTGAEMEYIVRNGLNVEEIPDVCIVGSSAEIASNTFIRSNECDVALAKLGIVLPKPTAEGRIPEECMVDERTSVSPEECRNIVKQTLIIDTVPKECQDAEVTNSEECGQFMQEKRVEEGIGIDMPGECMGVSIEECKVIMQEKGIEVKKVDQSLPKECISMGVGDVTDCNMIAGKVNEERIKSGDKAIFDENGKVDYVNPEQIEKIVDESEKASQDVKPDFEKAEEMKQEINNLEQNMNQMEERTTQEARIDGDSNQGDGEGNNVVEQQNEVQNEVHNEVVSGNSGGNNEVVGSSGGSESGSNNVVESSGGSSGGDSGGSESSGGDSEGGSSLITGATIGSGSKESFLERILKKIFGME